MGGTNTAVNGLPPLPPGATLDPSTPPQQSSLPPLPPGATLDPPTTTEENPLKTASRVYGQLVWHGPEMEQIKGAVKGGMQTIAGLTNLINSHYGNDAQPSDVIDYKREHPGASDQEALDAVQGRSLSTQMTGPYRGPTSQGAKKNLQAAADWLTQHSQLHGMYQHLGNIGESIAELMGPEALAALGKPAEIASTGAKAPPVLSYVQRLKQGQNVAQIFKDYPVLAHLTAIGLQTTKAVAEAAGQTYVKTGGDTEQTKQAGMWAGIGGAAMETGAAALKPIIKAISPTMEEVGGEMVPRRFDQRPHQTPVDAAQQAAGNRVIQQGAQHAVEQHLGEVNEGRVLENKPKALPASTTPYKFTIETTPVTEDTTGAIAHEPVTRYKQVGTRTVEGKGSSNPTPSADFNQELYTSNGTKGDVEENSRLQKWLRKNTSSTEAATPPTTQTVSHREPIWEHREFKPASAPGQEAQEDFARGGGTFQTEDPTVAKQHIGALSDQIDAINERLSDPQIDPETQAGLEDRLQRSLRQRNDLQRQMGEYHEARRTGQTTYSPYQDTPTFEPVDIKKTVARVGNYADAADELEGAAKPVYDRLDDLTGGRFTRLREENKRAWTAVTNGGGEAAEARLTRTQQEMDAMLSGHDGQVGDSVSQTDLSYANEAWKKAQILRDIDRHIESSFDTSLGASQRANAYRGFNGNLLRSNLKALSDKYTERTIGRIMGSAQYDNLVKIADITRTNADRAAFNGGVNHIAEWMVEHDKTGRLHTLLGAGGVGAVGAAAFSHFGAPGAGAVLATAGGALAVRSVLRKIATDPAVGRQFTFAIESGARPEFYAPMIARIIMQNSQPQQGGTQ